MKHIMHTTKISLPEKDRIELVGMLNETLASTADLYAQLKQAHWNVKGPNFIALHTLLDQLAAQILAQVDIIAERITSLGGTALGTTQTIGQNTKLRVYPTNIFTGNDHIEHLSHNYAILGEICRTNIKKTESLHDMATSDFYIALTQELDKSLWFLEAHVQK